MVLHYQAYVALPAEMLGNPHQPDPEIFARALRPWYNAGG